jgi:hypothetical protein
MAKVKWQRSNGKGKWQRSNGKGKMAKVKWQRKMAKENGKGKWQRRMAKENGKGEWQRQMENGKCNKVVNVTVFGKINVHFILFSFFDSYKKLPPNNLTLNKIFFDLLKSSPSWGMSLGSLSLFSLIFTHFNAGNSSLPFLDFVARVKVDTSSKIFKS